MASSAKKVIDNIVEFVEIKTEQIKLRIIARVAKMLSGVIAVALLGFFSLFFIFFLSFAFAQLINFWMGSIYWGYLIIASLYLLVIIVIFLLVKSGKLQKAIENLIVKLEEAKYEQERND